MLNPIFSINHMRHMMPMFYDVGHKVRIPTSVGPWPLPLTNTYPSCFSFPVAVASVLRASLRPVPGRGWIRSFKQLS